MYKAIRLNAESIFEKPLLERRVTGRRLLGVSREFLRRINMLGLVYLIEGQPKYLDRIDQEVLAVCAFEDWNPSHYLDVAEMAMGVALAIDWTADNLPKPTQQEAIAALIEKGINPSWTSARPPGWVKGSNNWNQVCNGGMIAASIAVAEQVPELAAKTISRALNGLPHALAAYGPDGAYPEGSTYWSYGTSFSVVTIAIMESAFGNDFGMIDYPAFLESAWFRVMCNAPSGWYYNFADCGDKRSSNGDLILAWFAAKTGNQSFFERSRFLRDPESMGKLPRLAGASLAWLAQFQQGESSTMPLAWKAEGDNPIVIFQDSPDSSNGYYFGGKGGRGMVNHGNMDAGSFIFELHGVRWVIDPGNQPYHELERTGFDLWNRCQDCQRWTLLTKNNFGHSTITINKNYHNVEGMVTLEDFQTGANPEATFDMTLAFKNQLKSASRRFVKDGPASLTIVDEIMANHKTDQITWQLLTQAEVEFKDGFLLLHQDGQQLSVTNLSHPNLTASIIQLDPPPLDLDRRLQNLKRIEFNYQMSSAENEHLKIEVRLQGK